MRFQLLGCRERRRARPDRAQAIGGEFLHGDLLLVTGHRHAAVAARVTVGRQYVIAAAAVIAHRFGRPLAEENRARAVAAVETRARSGPLQAKVVGRELSWGNSCWYVWQ